MDMNNGPRSRGKKVSGQGNGVGGRRGEGLGTGPVNNTGNYADRKEQSQNFPRNTGSFQGRPQQIPFGNQSSQNRPPVQNTQFPGFTGNRTTQGRQQNRQQSASPFSQASRPSTGSGFSSSSQYSGANRTSAQQQSTRPVSGGGGGKFILIILAAILLLGGGRLTGLLGGSDQNAGTSPVVNSNGSSNTNVITDHSGGSGLGNLLNVFLGSGGSSVYDTTGFTSFSSGSPFSGGGSGSNSVTPELDRTVAKAARDKRTVLKGNGKDKVTVMVYMCGTDLESGNGMGTADLKEMTKATIDKNVNLIVFTGGCKSWKNNVVSSGVNQIYQIRDGGLYRLEKDMGNASMTDPATLTKFIRYGNEKFSANRKVLIFWDHGGGSVSGFGYDEKNRASGSMSLAGINTALKNGGTTFDFIGFDSCLMATLENAIMLEQYADYLIGSEETEPGVGWYYTNWLTKLSERPDMPTIEIGKIIADDFVDVCAQKCRGQATTLSVIDLAELIGTVPKELKAFSESTNELIQSDHYAAVSKARGNSKEFAQSTGIDQVDLIHFADNVATEESKKLAKALKGAVKYNRTGGGIGNANGLSIYFPYKKAGKLKQAVSTYDAIEMDQEYTKCITEFASLEVSGQVSAGTDPQQYSSNSIGLSSLMGSLLGNGGYSSSSGSADAISGMLGGLFGGTGGSSMFDLFSGRSMSVEKTAEYIVSNHFDPDQLVWRDGKITLSDEQWNLVTGLCLNVFCDDGNGFIDLGMDNVFTRSGNALLADFDGTWLSIDGQPVTFYFMYDEEKDGEYLTYGYVPVLLNGNRADLLLMIDSEGNAEITGAHYVYVSGETETQAKTMISVGEGDILDPLCDYYDYNGNYRDSYQFGKQIVLGKSWTITNTPIGNASVQAAYCFTDIYQQKYWTPTVTQQVSDR